MQLPPGFLHTIERLLNHYLQLDAGTMQRMAQLDGRCIGIEFRGTGIRFYIQPGHEGVHVAGQAEQVDTMLHGTPLAMARLGFGNNGSKALFSGDVTITGDVETGQSFKAIIDDIDIDWEEQLSQLTGDVIAHQAGNAFRKLGTALHKGGATLQQDLAEYLKEEVRVVPARIEVENLAAGINRTRTDTDRLEARIRRLQSARDH
jgi:ubiquinone biosynthesis accessory factor UbiJ